MKRRFLTVALAALIFVSTAVCTASAQAVTAQRPALPSDPWLYAVVQDENGVDAVAAVHAGEVTKLHSGYDWTHGLYEGKFYVAVPGKLLRIDTATGQSEVIGTASANDHFSLDSGLPYVLHWDRHMKISLVNRDDLSDRYAVGEGTILSTATHGGFIYWITETAAGGGKEKYFPRGTRYSLYRAKVEAGQAVIEQHVLYDYGTPTLFPGRDALYLQKGAGLYQVEEDLTLRMLRTTYYGSGVLEDQGDTLLVRQERSVTGQELYRLEKSTLRLTALPLNMALDSFAQVWGSGGELFGVQRTMTGPVDMAKFDTTLYHAPFDGTSMEKLFVFDAPAAMHKGASGRLLFTQGNAVYAYGATGTLEEIPSLRLPEGYSYMALFTLGETRVPTNDDLLASSWLN